MTEDGDADKLTTNQKVVWIERDAAKWEGYEPKIEMIYDAKYGFLLSVYISITRRASVPARMRPDTMKLRFFTELQEFGVLRPEDSADYRGHAAGPAGRGEGREGRVRRRALLP